MTWKIIRICRFYNPDSKTCIRTERTEIIKTCRDRSKYKLANCDTVD